jgi:hypothetical protein
VPRPRWAHRALYATLGICTECTPHELGETRSLAIDVLGEARILHVQLAKATVPRA